MQTTSHLIGIYRIEVDPAQRIAWVFYTRPVMQAQSAPTPCGPSQGTAREGYAGRIWFGATDEWNVEYGVDARGIKTTCLPINEVLAVLRASSPPASTVLDSGYILRANLEVALQLAISSLTQSETLRHGPTFKSGQRAGFEEVLAVLRAGGQVRIR